MTRVAITGHVNVSEETADWVVRALTARLRDVIAPGWRGITCLARGADQLFAHVVLALDGRFEVVLPAADYELNGIDDSNRDSFRKLLAQAETVQTLEYQICDRTAYLAASEAMLSRCDLLLAVWDGEPSQQMGDTADVVGKAKERKIPVTVLWPPGTGARPAAEVVRSGAAAPARAALRPAAVPGPG